MITDINNVWLYAFSPDTNTPSKAYFTIFTGNSNGRAVYANISLSYLAALSTGGAGALIKSWTPPFGPDVVNSDFADNALFAPNAIAVTFAMTAQGAEAYAQGYVFFFG